MKSWLLYAAVPSTSMGQRLHSVRSALHRGLNVGSETDLEERAGWSELFERRYQRFHPVENGLFVGAGIAKEQSTTRQRLQAECGDGHDFDAHLRGQSGSPSIIFPGREPADKIQPGLRSLNLQ